VNDKWGILLCGTLCILCETLCNSAFSTLAISQSATENSQSFTEKQAFETLGWKGEYGSLADYLDLWQHEWCVETYKKKLPEYKL